MEIPYIEEVILKELLKRIKPVARFNSILGKNNLYYIKSVDPYHIAFTWDPKKGRLAKGLKELTRIVTYHDYAYYGFFKPSIAEVISQIPKELLDSVVAFETKFDKFDNKNDCHVAITTLYKREK